MSPTNSSAVAFARSWGRSKAGGTAAIEGNSLEDGRKIERSIACMMQQLHQPVRAAELAARVNILLSRHFTRFKSVKLAALTRHRARPWTLKYQFA